MSTIICEFCDKVLSSKQSLKTHQLKTKYCLEKQSIVTSIVLKTNIETCQYCTKTFTYLCSKNQHELICPEKEIQTRIQLKLLETQLLHNKEIDEYKKEISSLKEDIRNLEIKYTKEKSEIYTTLFNKEREFSHTQTSALNLSGERLESIKDTYTIKHYERGGIGQADWVVENVLKDEGGNLIYKCTDKNRKNFIYQDDKGNIVNDIHAKRLKEAIFPVIETKLKEYKKVKCSQMAEVNDDDSELLEKYSELYKENRELGNEFDKRLIEKTYV